jgi:hypothetical protein
MVGGGRVRRRVDDGSGAVISTRGRSGERWREASSRQAWSSGVFGWSARWSQAEGERGVLCMCVVRRWSGCEG